MPFIVPKEWTKLSLDEIDQKVYGRTVDAYRRNDGLMLIHHKYVGKENKMYRRCGMWYVAYDGRLIRRKCYYETPAGPPPFKWARERASEYFKERHEKNPTPVPLLGGVYITVNPPGDLEL